MQKLLYTFLAIASMLTIPTQAQNKYVGAKICVSCHNTEQQGRVFDHWQQSKHQDAHRTLAMASESKPRKLQDLELWIVTMGRGVKYGLPKPAVESEHCLPCHTTAFGADAKLIASSFDPKDGIQCESCHGPGSAHGEVETMKMNGKSIAASEVATALQIAKVAGLKRYEDERAIKAHCVRCHDGTCGEFDFATAWPRIKHSIPRNN